MRKWKPTNMNFIMISDYSNSLSLDSYCEYMIYDERVEVRKNIEESQIQFFLGI